MQSLAAGNIEAIVELLDFGTHGAQISRHQGDAVGFLDAQFLCLADANAAASEGTDGSQDREFVDELRSQRAADFGGSEALSGGGDLHGANQLRMFFFEIEDSDARAEGGEDVEQRGAGGIEAEASR